MTRSAKMAAAGLLPAFPAVFALLVGLTGPLMAQGSGSYQVVGSVAAYLGVIPAEIVGGHPAQHPEARMHGGPPGNAHAEHIVIALFEDPSGTRIEDATVEATIAGLGGIGVTSVALDPMTIADTVTFGTFFPFGGPDTYTIDLRITRPGDPIVTRISFVYDHGAG